MTQGLHRLGMGQCRLDDQTDAGACEQQPHRHQHDQRHQHHEAAGGRERRTDQAHRRIGGAAHLCRRSAPDHAETFGRMVDQREDRALQQLGRPKLDGDAAPDELHQFQNDIGKTEGDQQLRHMAELVHPAKTQALEHGAQGADHQRRDHQRRPEADQTRHGIADVGAHHVEAGVRKVQDAHHAEDEREPGTQHEQQQAIAQPVEHRDDEKLHSKSPS